MVSVPAIKRWGDVYGAIDANRVEGDGERKEPKRNISQRKRERKRVEGAGGEPGEHECGNEQGVAMDEGKVDADQRKCRRSKKQNSPWSHQTAEIHGEGADEDERNVVGAADPCAVVEANSDMAPQISKAESNHAARERDNSRAHDYAQDPKQGAF